MRILITFSIVFLLITHTIKSAANESKTIQAMHGYTYPNFVISSSLIN